LLGDIHDALMLLAFAGLSIVIELVQTGRTDRAIAALGELGSLASHRDPRWRAPEDPSAAEVVRGDLLVVGEGDRVSADGWLVEAESLQADESAAHGRIRACDEAPARRRRGDRRASGSRRRRAALCSFGNPYCARERE
jgi:Ca2+-transporting ATPase